MWQHAGSLRVFSRFRLKEQSTLDPYVDLISFITSLRRATSHFMCLHVLCLINADIVTTQLGNV